MRIAGWVFVVCSVLGIVGLFMPAVGVENAPGFIAKRTSLSLYAASTKREVTQRVFAAYHKLPGKGLGHAIASALIPRTGKRLGGVIDDVNSAAETLDSVSDDDIGLAGKALVAALWILLALNGLAGALVFAEAMSTRPPKIKRLVVGAVFALLTAIFTTAIMMVCREVAWQANDEIGKQIVGVGIGAYILFVAGIGSFLSGTTFLVMAKRAQRNAPTTSS